MKLSLELIFLCNFLSLVAVIFATPQEDIDACRKACTDDYMPWVRKFSDSQIQREELGTMFSDIWPNCKSKCNRCILKETNTMMDALLRRFNDPNRSLTSTVMYTTSIEYVAQYNTKSCYKQWDAAILANDDTCGPFL